MTASCGSLPLIVFAATDTMGSFLPLAALQHQGTRATVYYVTNGQKPPFVTVGFSAARLPESGRPRMPTGPTFGKQNQQAFELPAAVVSRLHRRSNAVENGTAKARPFAFEYLAHEVL
jgi:hypothetical protein